MARYKSNHYEDLQPGMTSKMLKHLREVSALGEGCDLSHDPDGVRERIQKYFDLCEEADLKPTQSGLSMAIGITRRANHKWRTGELGKNEETRKILIAAQSVLECLMEGYMTEGQINPVAGIFVMRNNYGYKNEDVRQDEPAPQLEGADIKALEEKYRDSVT